MSIRERIRKHMEGAPGVLLSLYTAFIFLAYVFLKTDKPVYLLKWAVPAVALSFAICPWLLRRLRKIRFPEGLPEEKDQGRWKLIFCLVPLGLLLAKYLIYYPGGFTTDSAIQYGQAISNQYNDWNPVIQTLICFKLPLMLTGGWTGSVILFQILLFAGAIGYALCTIRQYAGTRYGIGAMIFILLNPGITNIAMFPWKDVTFAIGTILLVSFALHIVFTRGEWIRKPLHWIGFVLIAGLATLVRHNALLFTVPLVFAMIFYLGWKQSIAVCAGIILLIGGIKGPLYSVLQVEKPDNRQAEMLGLPMTVIGAVVKYAPEDLDEETREFAFRAAPEEVWEKYEYGEYNPVKWSGGDSKVIEEYGAGRILAMAWRCLTRSPKAALTGLIRLTDPVYTVCDDYLYYDLPVVEENDYGITMQGIPFLQRINGKITTLLCGVFPWMFMYIGAMHWALIAFILAKRRLSLREDRKRILAVLPVLVYNFGTALLLTGASDSARFFQYTFMIMPMMLILIGRKNTEK